MTSSYEPGSSLPKTYNKKTYCSTVGSAIKTQIPNGTRRDHLSEKGLQFYGTEPAIFYYRRDLMDQLCL